MEISSNSVIDDLRRANEPQPETPDNGRLTQQDFFRLLTTELAQQDPDSTGRQQRNHFTNDGVFNHQWC